MNRLEKKCLLASAGVHSLLLLILFVGPAFLAPSHPPDNMPVLDFIPYKTVDAMVSGGGNPNPRPLPAPPPTEPPKPLVQSAPPPAPEPKRQPEPEPVVQPKPDPDSLEFDTEKPRKPKISTDVVTRGPDAKEAKKRAEQKAREAKQQADARRRLAAQIGDVAQVISSGLSQGTEIELKGPGGGGIPYANFLQAVKSRYANAWVVPDGVTDNDATTTASVTIARDGTVVSRRITRHSGNVEVDRSVQRTLDEVTWAAPLPDDAKENERTVSINFNVRAKRTSG